MLRPRPGRRLGSPGIRTSAFGLRPVGVVISRLCRAENDACLDESEKRLARLALYIEREKALSSAGLCVVGTMLTTKGSWKLVLSFVALLTSMSVVGILFYYSCTWDSGSLHRGCRSLGNQIQGLTFALMAMFLLAVIHSFFEFQAYFSRWLNISLDVPCLGCVCSTRENSFFFSAFHYHLELMGNVVVLTCLLLTVSLATADWEMFDKAPGISRVLPNSSAAVYMGICMWLCVISYFGLSVLINPADFAPFSAKPDEEGEEDPEYCSTCESVN